MSHSHAEPAALPCRACGSLINADVWVIVDIDERPDLLARLRAGTLHELRCPSCGRTDTVNAPLLIYRPGEEPPLLFSPARSAERVQDEEQALALVAMFRENAGGAWRDEWLARGLTGAAREALPALLAGDPVTTARLAEAAAADDAVAPPIRETLETILVTLGAEGVRVNSAEELRQALEARPELKARLAAVLGAPPPE